MLTSKLSILNLLLDFEWLSWYALWLWCKKLGFNCFSDAPLDRLYDCSILGRSLLYLLNPFVSWTWMTALPMGPMFVPDEENTLSSVDRFLSPYLPSLISRWDFLASSTIDLFLFSIRACFISSFYFASIIGLMIFFIVGSLIPVSLLSSVIFLWYFSFVCCNLALRIYGGGLGSFVNSSITEVTTDASFWPADGSLGCYSIYWFMSLLNMRSRPLCLFSCWVLFLKLKPWMFICYYFSARTGNLSCFGVSVS